MKISSVEKLEDKLEQDLSWRKKEILSLKILTDSDTVNRGILLRAGIALLCAHFEGFIKNASNYYVVYVSSKGIPASNIIYPLIAIKLKKNFEVCAKSEKSSVHTGLIEKLEQVNSQKFMIKYTQDKPIISTESNPSSNVLKEILKSIGVDSDIFETKKQYIDYSLLQNRHKVVHGDRHDLEYDDFINTYSIVLQLIDSYKELIVEAAEKELYLKGIS